MAVELATARRSAAKLGFLRVVSVVLSMATICKRFSHEFSQKHQL
jgi:hypothetical protein